MNRLALSMLCAVAVSCAGAVTIHRSFRPTVYGTGGGTGVIGPGFGTQQSVNFGAPSAAVQQKPKTKTFSGRVTEVVDGDTVMVTPTGGTKRRVELDRIDAPELDQPWGAEAKKMLSNLVLNKKVEVRYTERDKKGTTIGVMFLKHEKGTVDVNLSMILSGAAWYGGNADDIPAYRNAEASARNAKIGLWAAEAPVSPEEWRKSKGVAK